MIHHVIALIEVELDGATDMTASELAEKLVKELSESRVQFKNTGDPEPRAARVIRVQAEARRGEHGKVVWSAGQAP